MDLFRSMTRASASFLAKDVHSYHNKGVDSSDISLVSNDVRFKAHKFILAARSDVFAAMFQHDGTKEAETKEVEIIEFDNKTIERFLEYVWQQ